MIQLQIYTMVFQESILMNTMNYQMLEGKKWSLNPKTLFLEGYDFDVQSENEGESTDKEESVDLHDMSPLEDDKEGVRKEKD